MWFKLNSSKISLHLAIDNIFGGFFSLVVRERETSHPSSPYLFSLAHQAPTTLLACNYHVLISYFYSKIIMMSVLGSSDQVD